jgi:superfamily II DNA or RNA helicase
MEKQNPRPHQIEAINACVVGLTKPGSRGQCIMACGTGKTLVGYEVAQRLGLKRVLALVPSLLLVNQLVREYRRQGAQHILSVCSDEGAGGEDSIQISVRELEADNTTDAKAARAFLAGPGQRIVVCTYQSLRSLSEVFDGLHFDLAIFDEAHKTAGGKSKLFAHALKDNGLTCERRLFMTATPRHAKLKEDGSTSQVYAMNDPEVYGPVLYSLPLRAAIEAGIIDDYRIVVAIVSEAEREELREQAIRVAIDKARAEFGIRKVFTFHSRVADAGGFILGATDTLKGMRLYHVSGQQTSRERDLKLAGFAASDAALMSNARCLTEGVDLPAADMVAFLSAKRNPIDIVQAVGRVLRKHESKAKGGFVFLPVFVLEGEDEESAIAKSDWSGVYDVLQAMREQDEPLAAKLKACARGDGEVPEQVSFVDARTRTHRPMEADRVLFADAMWKAIRAKVLRPFRYDPESKMAELLRMARAGDPRPSGSSKDVRERRLGGELLRYTRPRSNAYQPSFDREIRMVSPQWFVDAKIDYEQMKRDLLEMAKAGKRRPSSNAKDPGERRIANALSTLIREKSQRFDPMFAKKLYELDPRWKFDGSVATRRKRELLDMARSGIPLPGLGGSRLGRALKKYTTPNGKCFDAEFANEIRRHVPNLSIRARDDAEIKNELLDMARSGKPKPSEHSKDAHERSLANKLRERIGPRAHQRHAGFASALLGIAPNWFK